MTKNNIVRYWWLPVNWLIFTIKCQCRKNSKLNINIVYKGNNGTTNTQIHDRTLPWLGPVTSIKSNGVKPVNNDFCIMLWGYTLGILLVTQCVYGVSRSRVPYGIYWPRIKRIRSLAHYVTNISYRLPFGYEVLSFSYFYESMLKNNQNFHKKK